MAQRIDYDNIAKTYDRRYQENEYMGVEQALLQFVGSKPGIRVLEVGCGTGHWLALLSQHGACVAGLDASDRMLAHARTRISEAELVPGRAEHLPWLEESFDRVFCINALHHFSDKVAFLAEARRVLRLGGLMLTIGLDPHTGIDQWYIYDYFKGTLEIDKRRYPTSKEIQEWMYSVGFEECATSEVQYLRVLLAARDALDQGRLDKMVTSQLILLTDEEYRQGIEQIRRDLERAEDRGQSLHLSANLRLYGTIGSAGTPR